MDKERGIKKIAKILEEADCIEDALFIDFDRMAKALINAGYGDTKQAVREFAEGFIEEVKSRIKELNVFLDDECRYILEETLDYMDELLAEVTGE